MVASLRAGQQLEQAAAAGVTAIAGSVQKITKDVEQWFDTVLDRTRDVFAFLRASLLPWLPWCSRSAGGWTPCICFGAFRNDDVRNRIVEGMQATTDQVSQILPQAQAGAQAADLHSLERQIRGPSGSDCRSRENFA